MENSQQSTPTSSPRVPLLPGFLSIKQFQNLESKALKGGQLVNVVGFLKDFQPPVLTKGSDAKCTFEIKDSSVQYESSGLKVNIFWAMDKMPRFDGVGDAVIVRNAKAQMWSGFPSLIANWSTEFHILPASQIPTSLSKPANVTWRSYPPKKGKSPTAAETAYIVAANGCIEDMALPSAMEFQQKTEQAMNVKCKFSVLKDVKDQGFYDILGEVIHVYSANFDRVSLYLSDYTENSSFYNNERGAGDTSNCRDGDEHGYTKKLTKTMKTWPGPYGRSSIQLTLYDGHATFVREQVKAGDWVLLRNVQIKYGNMGGYLEGFLRGDRDALEGKVQVEIMRKAETPDENDIRWTEAVGRKFKWTRKEQQKQDPLDQASGEKRKREDDPARNSKARRKERRAAAEGKAAATEARVKVKLDLHESIRCNHPDQPTTLLADILKPRIITAPKGQGQEYHSPFDVRKYKANVRVVDFFPPKIEDFAVGRRASEFDILPDYSGGEDTDPGEEMRAYRSGKGFPEKQWEWRFALQVVDASDKLAVRERTWLVVSNEDAQLLLDMDATNLRKEKDTLRRVKEQLWQLWGDLEEQKSATTLSSHTSTPSTQSKSMAPSSDILGDLPPLDSDDEQENEGKISRSKFQSATAGSEREPNASVIGRERTSSKSRSSELLHLKNKAFTCCIKQYGVEISESDPSLANGGDGKRWARQFGLFGTQIR